MTAAGALRQGGRGARAGRTFCTGRGVSPSSSVMFPVSDDNPTLRRPVVTYALLATLLLVFVVVYFHYLQGFFSATLSAIFVVVAAAVAIGWHESVIMALLKGRYGGFSTDRLLRLLLALDRDVDIVVKPARARPHVTVLVAS